MIKFMPVTNNTIVINSKGPKGEAGGSNITVKDEGSNLTTSLDSIDFVGSGVVASTDGDAVTVTITGGGGGAAITVSDEGSSLTTEVASFNFTGVGITASEPTTNNIEVNVPGDISIDTTPQLGGNLDVNGNDIVSVSNGDIELAPDGTGSVTIKGNATGGSGKIVLNCEQNSHGVTIQGPAHSAAATYTLTLPDNDGDADQFLQTDGSGALTWADGGSATTLDGQKIRYQVRTQAETQTGDFEGFVCDLTGTEGSLTPGLVYCWNGTAWVAADATSAANSDGILGIALGINNTSGFLLEGIVYYASSTPGSADGDVLYLDPSLTGFRMTSTAPTSDGNILRVVGQRMDANRILFKPSQDFVELGAAAGTTGLSDLSDAAVTTPAAGHLLIYDNTDSQFENATLTAGTNVSITNADASITIDACDGTEIEFASQSTAVNAAGEAEGTIVKFGTGTLTAGKVYTFGSGAWVAVDANAEATTKGLLGMALGTSPTTNGLLVHGVGYLDHDPGTAGDTLYIGVGATAGQLTGTQPTDAADFVRVVGYCLADNKVFFSPSQDYIDLA